MVWRNTHPGDMGAEGHWARISRT